MMKQFTCPSTLKIGPYTYRIEEEARILNKHGEELDGKVDFVTEAIVLRNDMTPTRRHYVVWHEVLHALDRNVDANLSEKQVIRLGHALAAFMIDNPALVSELHHAIHSTFDYAKASEKVTRRPSLEELLDGKPEKVEWAFGAPRETGG
jgi:hypothetical protein